MRTFLTLVALTAFSAVFLNCQAAAQDPGMDAAQQAMQQSIQLSQQASQQAMQDMQTATQNAQQAMQNAQSSPATWPGLYCPAAMPSFSVKAGKYSGAVTVKIRDTTRGAVIYYTTDGWTPTGASTRYRGPITIHSTTTLQAVAFSPEGGRSRVATAIYSVNGPPPPPVESPGLNAEPVTEDGRFLLAEGTPVPLVFVSSVNSKTSDVGDKISMTLAEDLKVGNVTLVKKGAPATATVTEADRNGVGGLPGAVYFEADSLLAGDVTINLRGGAAKEGQDKFGKAFGLMFVPVVPAALFVRGKEAEIMPGAIFTAYVDADTLLLPAK
jgi:hypothetical protein